MAAVVFAACLLAQGVAPAVAEMRRPVRIGALTTSWGPTPGEVGLRDGLVKLGYRENQDFVIGTRFTSGDGATLPLAARELIKMGVDIMFAAGAAPALAAQQATSRVPVVFLVEGDPVQIGLVSSYARPGANLTGISSDETALAPKRLEFFKRMIPELRRVMFVFNALDRFANLQALSYRRAGKRLGVELLERPVRTEAEAEAVVSRVGKTEVDGMLVTGMADLNIPGFILQAGARAGVPGMFTAAFWPERGGFASYAANNFTSGRQAARLVEKIMRGENPADIPVEVNNEIEFVINLKVAKSLGLEISPEVLYQAHRIIR
ncbi:MAG: ABC transporter substrate-binding protein [SAR324 cluster bacterium]|nr:ABC transporter substrate-binding protein [SAR324 cluster bacterium]